METLKFEEFGKGEWQAFPGVETEHPHSAEGKIDGFDATWIMDGCRLSVLWEEERKSKLTGKTESFSRQQDFPHILNQDAIYLFASAISNDISSKMVQHGYGFTLTV